VNGRIIKRGKQIKIYVGLATFSDLKSHLSFFSKKGTYSIIKLSEYICVRTLLLYVYVHIYSFLKKVGTHSTVLYIWKYYLACIHTYNTCLRVYGHTLLKKV